MGLVACITISISIAMIFACTPIWYGWMPMAKDHCVDKAAIQYAGSSLNLVTDLLVLLLPIKYLWGTSTS
jgi:hypothetical protein